MVEVTDEIIPNELKNAFSEMELWNNGYMCIKSIAYEAEDVEIIFEIKSGDELPTYKWKITVVGAHDEKVVRTWAEYIQIYSEHYLLWQFTDKQAALYVNGSSDSAEILAANFYAQHKANYGEWITLETHVPNLLGVCASKQAQFAVGPKRILDVYASWLDKYDRRPYFFPSESFVQNSDSDNKSLKLLTFGECYFIGKEFIFTKVVS